MIWRRAVPAQGGAGGGWLDGLTGSRTTTLHGYLGRLRDIGLPLISVIQVEPEEPR